MPERSFESSPEISLADAQSRRKGLIEKLSNSPWKWALMAVMALESQGCAMPKQVGWLALEPNATGGMDYDIKYGQQGTGQDYVPRSAREATVVDASRGMHRQQQGPETPLPPSATYAGPRAYLEFIPPNARPSIDQVPEGFDGSNPQNFFAVTHGTPRDLLRRMAARGQSDSARLDNVMRTSIRPEEIRNERQAVAARAVNLLLPHLPDRKWGIRMEWQDVQHQDPEQGKLLTISCRTSPWAAPSRESASRRPAPGHQLEHDVLSDNQTVWANMGGAELYFSPEKSSQFPQRPAQAAFASKPIKLVNWNQAQARLTEAKTELAALPKTETSMSRPEVVRHRAKVAELNKQIADLNRLMDSAFNESRLEGIRVTMGKMLPLIKDNEIRFYVRLDERSESMQVIAVIDDPDISKI
ncbi:hypothetical protein HZC53_00245 [Candidatus Uhrbacteria bacterium]|nr:hypothetical protein [Candidatus Uhrbacteria bacterium]